MNKQELINELKNKTFVKKLTKFENKMLASEGLELYEQHYLELENDVMKEKSALIIVENEGTELEEANWFNRKPETSIHPLVEKYQTTIDSVNGKVIDKGENFIVVQGYDETEEIKEDGKVVKIAIPKTWFAKEVDGKLEIKLVK